MFPLSSLKQVLIISLAEEKVQFLICYHLGNFTVLVQRVNDQHNVFRYTRVLEAALRSHIGCACRKGESADLGPGTWDLGPGTWDLGDADKRETWDLGPGTWDLGPGTWEMLIKETFF